MKTYRFDPQTHAVLVYAQDHSRARSLGAMGGPYSAAQAILTDARGRDTSAEFMGAFARKVIATRGMDRAWEITLDEISVWIETQREGQKDFLADSFRQHCG